MSNAEDPVPPCRPGCERCAKALRTLGPVGYNNWRSWQVHADPPEVHEPDRIIRDHPICQLAEEIDALTSAVMTRTGRHGIARVSLTPDVGLAFGIVPGMSIDVHTPAGRVEVYAERTPRHDGTFTMPTAFGDIPVHMDPTMPPGTIEMRSAGSVMRVKVDPELATELRKPDPRRALRVAPSQGHAQEESDVSDQDPTLPNSPGDESALRLHVQIADGFSAGVLRVAWERQAEPFEIAGRAGRVHMARLVEVRTQRRRLCRDDMNAALTGLVVRSPDDALSRIAGVESRCMTTLGEGADLGILLVPVEEP